MSSLRAFLYRHRRLALALIVLALAMKAVMPVGFMPSAPGKVFTVMICDGAGDMKTAKIAIPGQNHGGTSDSAKDGACPYAGLSFAALGGTDALLAAALLLFILALGFAPATIPTLRRGDHFQPPLRGPPAFA